MNPWKIFAGCGLLVALFYVAATAQDNKKKADNRPAQELAYLQNTVVVAQKAYLKLQAINAKNPGRISDEDLSGASLEWLKTRIAPRDDHGGCDTSHVGVFAARRPDGRNAISLTARDGL